MGTLRAGDYFILYVFKVLYYGLHFMFLKFYFFTA